MNEMGRFGWFALSGLLGVAAISGTNGDAGLTSTLSLLMLGAALAGCAWWVKNHARAGAILSALLCAACNLYLLSSKIDSEAGYSMCGADGGGCGILNQLPESEFMGLPVTLFGAMFYFALACAGILGKDDAPDTHKLNGTLGGGALLFCAYLAWVALSVKAFCPFCVTIYVGTGLILWSAFLGMNPLEGKVFEGFASLLGSSTFLTWMAMFTIGLLMGVPYIQAQIGGDQNPVRFETTAPSPAPDAAPAPRNPLDGLAMRVSGRITVTGDEPLLGDANAPYLIVEWADYACPHCATASSGLKALVESTPDVQVRFKHFPLSGLCNPSIPTEEQAERCLAAIAAKCTQPQGKFWEYQASLFANQVYLFHQSRNFEQDLAHMAERAGVDRSEWDACITDESITEELREEARQGTKAGVRGTPFITLQGVYDRPVQVVDARAAAMLIEAHKLGRPLPAPVVRQFR